jgi:hypothetical protein
MLRAVGVPTAGHRVRAYVLCGYSGDTVSDANRRMRETVAAGFIPMAMLWRGDSGKAPPGWGRFTWSWSRPAVIAAMVKEVQRG